MQEQRKVQIGGTSYQTGNMFDGINFERHFPQSFPTLRDQFLNQADNVFHIDPPLDLFHGEGSISVRADDFLELVTPEEWLTVLIIQIFMM